MPNLKRGPMLYALVAARRPRVVLEFGTGRGYGALSMARAMADYGIDGNVWTIDVVRQDEAFAWLLRDDAGPRTAHSSREQTWRASFPSEWIDRIVPLHGKSTDVMRSWPEEGRSIDLAFVDGGHDLATARHDLLAACAFGGDRLGVLADDYVERPGYGVVTAFRELLGEPPPVTVVQTSWGDVQGGPDAGMAWVEPFGRPGERERLRALWTRRPRGGIGALIGR